MTRLQKKCLILAFVLLSIFVITRPLLEQNIDLQLPKNMGGPDVRHIIRLVEITAGGEYYYQGRHTSLRQLETNLKATFAQNPKLIVDIRADKRTPWDNVIAVIDACLRNHITQFSAKTAPVEIWG